MKSFDTGTGKIIQLVRDEKTQHIKVQFTSGGEIPFDISGLYTSERAAERDIHVYIEKNKEKKSKNG